MAIRSWSTKVADRNRAYRSWPPHANIATIKKLAMAGMGLAVLPEIAMELEFKQKLLKPIEIEEAHMDRPVTVYWKEKRVLSRPAQKFLDFIRAWGTQPDRAAKAVS